jgi:hypothetical protein
MTDLEIKIKGFQILSKELGVVEAEKFIALIIHEPFDYTIWQKNLWADKSIGEISKEAMKQTITS